MLLITTPGADPSIELSEVAAATVGRGALREVAMGQGQAEGALQLLQECAKSGGWRMGRILQLYLGSSNLLILKLSLLNLFQNA
jgi:dynein heavy chain 2